MSLLYKDVFAYLATTSPVKEMVGTRIFGLVIPQLTAADIEELGGPYPAIRYEESVIEHYRHLDGGSQTCQTSLQIDCYAESYPAVKALADGVRRILDTYQGRMGDTTIDEVILNSEEDIYEDPVDASDTGQFRVMLDFTVTHSETLPLVSHDQTMEV